MQSKGRSTPPTFSTYQPTPIKGTYAPLPSSAQTPPLAWQNSYTPQNIPLSSASLLANGGNAAPSSSSTTTTTASSSSKDANLRPTGINSAATAGTNNPTFRRPPIFKGLFQKDLKNLLYAFGDDKSPANDTVSMLEEILVEYILDLCNTAANAPSGRKTRLAVDDLRRALSRPEDDKKLARMEELLFMQEVIRRARAQFDEKDPAGLAADM